ncbi:GNAT family N-acetyltransferase [Devosia sp. YIM 151766]|nr:GNAT family N-acetyltransferase [Devosia sp. YIM 151766]WIY53891.1 GNAT family N-acetyltransferase [Devosia sp. YIM 151766]
MLESVGRVQGFAMGMGPNAAGEALFWQIGIAGSHRGQGHGKSLAAALIRGIRQQGGRRVLVTIAEDNLVSRRLFEGCAFACNTRLVAVGPIPCMADDIQAETLYGFDLPPEAKCSEWRV